MANKLILISLLLSLAACSSVVTVQAPANRFITSESQGEKIFRGRAIIGAHGGSEIEIINNKFDATPTANPEIQKDSGTHLGVEMNLVPRVDAYWVSNYNSYDVLGFKLQVIGDNVKAAKAAGFSFAVGAGVLMSGASDNDEEDEGAVKIKVKTDFDGFEYFALFGYRPWDSLLIYAGPWLVEFELDSKLNRTASGSTTQTMHTSGEGKQQNVVLGLQYGGSFKLNLEGAYATTEYKAKTPAVVEADDEDFFVWGAALSYNW